MNASAPVPHRVLIAHRHPPLADLIRDRLSTEPGLSICGVAFTVTTLRVLVRAFEPDILILDSHIDNQGLGPLCRHFHLAHARLRLIVLTSGPRVEDLRPIFAAVTTVPVHALATQLRPAVREITGRSVPVA